MQFSYIIVPNFIPQNPKFPPTRGLDASDRGSVASSSLPLVPPRLELRV